MPGGGPTFLSTFELEPTAEGTRLHVRFGPPRSKRELALMEEIRRELAPVMEAGFRALTEQVTAEAKARTEGRELEPELPRPKADGPLAEMWPLEVVG
jgi:hypothetical protein